MNNAHTPQPEIPATNPAGQPTTACGQDVPAWRLIFQLTTKALDSGRETFVRLLILALLFVGVLAVLALILGPYPFAAFGASTVATTAYVKRGRTRTATTLPPAPG